MKRSKLPSAARLRFMARLTRDAERERKLLALAEQVEEEVQVLVAADLQLPAPATRQCSLVSAACLFGSVGSARLSG
jgi:hypothetical protein